MMRNLDGSGPVVSGLPTVGIEASRQCIEGCVRKSWFSFRLSVETARRGPGVAGRREETPSLMMTLPVTASRLRWCGYHWILFPGAKLMRGGGGLTLIHVKPALIPSRRLVHRNRQCNHMGLAYGTGSGNRGIGSRDCEGNRCAHFVRTTIGDSCD